MKFNLRLVRALCGLHDDVVNGIILHKKKENQM